MSQKPSQLDPLAVDLETVSVFNLRDGITHKSPVAAAHILDPYFRIRFALLPRLYHLLRGRSTEAARLHPKRKLAVFIGDAFLLQDYIIAGKTVRTTTDLKIQLRPRNLQDGVVGVGRYQNGP